MWSFGWDLDFWDFRIGIWQLKIWGFRVRLRFQMCPSLPIRRHSSSCTSTGRECLGRSYTFFVGRISKHWRELAWKTGPQPVPWPHPVFICQSKALCSHIDNSRMLVSGIRAIKLVCRYMYASSSSNLLRSWYDFQLLSISATNFLSSVLHLSAAYFPFIRSLIRCILFLPHVVYVYTALNEHSNFIYGVVILWSPYVIGRQYIFSCCGLFFFFFFFFFFFPRLISAAADWMSAILPHMVWP